MFRIEIQVVEAQMDFILSALEKVDRFVDRDAVNPGEEARVALEVAQGFVRLDESFLRQVIGVLVIGRHVINRRIDALLVALNECIECGVIPLLRFAH